MATPSSNTTSAVVKRHLTPGCKVPVDIFTMENYKTYLSSIELSNFVIKNPNPQRPDKVNYQVNDGLPGTRRVRCRLVKIMSKYGIGEKKDDEENKDANLNKPTANKPPSYGLTIYVRENVPEFQEMGDTLYQHSVDQVLEKSVMLFKKQISREVAEDKVLKFIRSAKKETSQAKYGDKWTFDIYPDNKNCRINWVPCSFYDLYDLTTKKGKGGAFTIDFEMSYLWELNGKLGSKCTIQSINLEPISDEDDSLQEYAMLQRLTNNPAPGVILPLLEGNKSNVIIEPNGHGVEHDILTKANDPNASNAASNKRARESDDSGSNSDRQGNDQDINQKSNQDFDENSQFSKRLCTDPASCVGSNNPDFGDTNQEGDSEGDLPGNKRQRTLSQTEKLIETI